MGGPWRGDTVGGSSGLGSSADNPYDVVVYMANFAGICAAIAAKRQGARVLLINPREDIGGMPVSGVAFTDSQSGTFMRSTITGIVAEIYNNADKIYNFGLQDYYRVNNYSCENKVMQVILNRMLQKEDIQVHNYVKITGLAKSGTTISSVTTDTMGTIYAKQYIDATYWGDLLPLAGCSYTVGREALAQYTETGYQAGTITAAANQPTNPVDPYIIAGDSASGLLPYVQAGTLQANGNAETTVQAMGMRLAMTNDASKIAFPAPSNYNPANYELFRRHLVANGSGWTNATDVLNFQNGFPAIPPATINKRDANNKGIFSLDYIHPDSTRYATATWDERAQINEDILQYTLGWFYFLQYDTTPATVAAVPAALRTSMLTWGLCPDEFVDNAGMSYYPYPREGRRMIGDFVVKAQNIGALNAFTDQVAQAYYAFDSHPCQNLASAGILKQEGAMTGAQVSIVGNRIPRRIYMPKVSECTNLAVVCAGSMTHAAYCAIRLEPIFGNIAEGAGINAALAAQKGTTLQGVTDADVLYYQDIYGWRNYGGASLSADGTYNQGTVVTVGTWGTSATYICGTTTIATCNATSATNTKEFQPTLQESTLYDVYVRFVDTSTTTRGTPTFTVKSQGSTVFTTTLNETYTAEGGYWPHLGQFFFKAGDATNNSVMITHDNTANATNIAGMIFIPARNNPKNKRTIL